MCAPLRTPAPCARRQTFSTLPHRNVLKDFAPKILMAPGGGVSTSCARPCAMRATSQTRLERISFLRPWMLMGIVHSHSRKPMAMLRDGCPHHFCTLLQALLMVTRIQQAVHRTAQRTARRAAQRTAQSAASPTKPRRCPQHL